MVSPTTSIDSTTGNVKISWVEPQTGNDPITSYYIEILYSGSTSGQQDTTYCDGSSATVMANMYCIIPMSTLTSSPYSYAFGELVKAKVYATNSFGSGSSSASNTAGATIR